MEINKFLRLKTNSKIRSQVDIIYLISFFFAAAITIAITIVVWQGLTSSPAYQSTLNTTQTGHIAIKATNTSLGIFANAIVFIFIFACIASLIAAAFASSSPAFAVLGIIAMPIEILFAFIFHDVFLNIISQSIFSNIVTSYPAMIYGFMYLPVITLIASLLFITIVFIKP